MKPFKAWLMLDAMDNYVPTLYENRRHAKEEAARLKHLRDAKWKVVRVVVRRADGGKA